MPGKHEYMLTLLNKIETFFARLRWKALFALQKFENSDEDTEIPLFKTRKYPPAVKEVPEFGKDLISILDIIKFRKK